MKEFRMAGKKNISKKERVHEEMCEEDISDLHGVWNVRIAKYAGLSFLARV